MTKNSSGEERYQAFVDELMAAVLESRGETDPGLRGAIVRGDMSRVPETLKPYVEKVARQAYTVTDEDIAALQRAGFTEDQIFEVTASAAVGAALLRMRRGLAALQGEGGEGGRGEAAP